jgi:enoyl-CoA hydratase/carnithine racemase
MAHDALRTEQVGHVLVLHIDDGKANALSASLLAAIAGAVRSAESDDGIRAVVLHGREGRFSGGFDLSVMTSGDLAAIVSLVSDGGDLVRLLYGASVPVVAACTGHALAAGALLLLGCDVRIGADIDAKIGLNEVAIKMVLPHWAMTMAGERLSRRHLQTAVANARITTPRDAVDVGFLDEVVPASDLLDIAVARATDLAATLDPRAYRETVYAMRGPTLVKLDAQIEADRAAGTAPTT